MFSSLPADVAAAETLQRFSKEGNDTWRTGRIKGLKSVPSPFAQSIPGLAEHRTPKLLASKLVYIESEPSNELPPKYELSNELVFRSDLAALPVEKEVNFHPPINGTRALFAEIPNAFDSLQHEVSGAPSLPVFDYLQVQLGDVTVPGTPVEPICFSVYIVDKEVMTEVWSFWGKSFDGFFKNMSCFRKCAFEMVLRSTTASMVVVANRIPQSSKVCNTYYLKPIAENLVKAKASVAEVWPRLKGIWVPFAFNTISLDAVNDSIELESMFVPDEPLTAETLPGQMEKARADKLAVLPIQLKLNKQYVRTTASAIDDGVRLCKMIVPTLLYPEPRVHNTLLVSLIGAKFESRVATNNVYCQITIQGSNLSMPMMIVQGKFNPKEMVETGVSKCTFCEGKLVFEDQWSVELPFNLPDTAILILKFFRASTSDDKSVPKPFATAVLPITGKNGSIIKDGVRTLSCSSGDSTAKSDSLANTVTIKTLLRSSVLSTDSSMSAFLSGGNLNINEVSDSAALLNLYLICDALLSGFSVDAQKAFSQLSSLTRLSKYPLLDVGFSQFVKNFAFREGAHRDVKVEQLLQLWNAQLSSKIDTAFCKFMFELIIKTIAVNHCGDITELVSILAGKIGDGVVKLSQNAMSPARVISESFGNFVNALCHLKFYMAAGNAIVEFCSHVGESYELTITCLERALHPFNFVTLLLCHDGFNAVVIRLISLASSSYGSALRTACVLLTRLLAFVPDECTAVVCEKLAESLVVFCELDNGRAKDLAFPLTLAGFVMSHVSSEQLDRVLGDIDARKFCGFLHFMLTQTKYSDRDPSKSGSRAPVARKGGILSDQFDIDSEATYREISAYTQFSVLRALQAMLTFGRKYEAVLNDVLFHIFSMNFSVNAIELAMSVFSRLATKSVGYMFESQDPPFVIMARKLVKVAGEHNTNASAVTMSAICSLFEAEREIFRSNNRGTAAFTRCLSLLNDSELESEMLLSALRGQKDKCIVELLACLEGMLQCNHRLYDIDRTHYLQMRDQGIVTSATNDQVNIEEYADVLWRKALVVMASPDAMLGHMQKLMTYHWKNGHLSEAIMSQVFEIALILEYLTVTGQIPNVFKGDHPAEFFVPMCSCCKHAICPEHVLADLPNIPSFCDSEMFNLSGLIVILQELINFCRQSRVYGLANEIVLLMRPVLERHRLFDQLGQMFKSAQLSYQVAAGTTHSERSLGRYYCVGFHGRAFQEQNGKVYIYRESKMSKPEEVTARITGVFSNVVDPSGLTVINNGSATDRRVFDPEKTCIHIAPVTPFFERRESGRREEREIRLDKFCCESEFTKGHHHVGVESQWIRKTIYSLKEAMPSVTKRVEVETSDVSTIDYEPIRVGCRSLKSRISSLREAVANDDAVKCQSLLHTSLIVETDEGLTKLAEVFLSAPAKTKYTEKMRGLFRTIMDLSDQALKILSEYSKTNAASASMTSQLLEAFGVQRARVMRLVDR